MAFNDTGDQDEEEDENFESLPLELREEYRFKNGAVYKG